VWEQRNAGSFNPQSFIDFLLSAPAGETSPVLAMRLASVVGPANVASFSYDLLRERGSNPAVFLVCNVTLALASAAWTTCDADLRARCADLPSKNVSPPPEALGTVRIVRLAWLLDCRSNGSSPTTPVERFALSARSHAVQAVAATLPTTCGNNESLATALADTADAEWQREAGIAAPAPHEHSEESTSSLCVVDERRLAPDHIRAIRGLLPACESAKKGGRSAKKGAKEPEPEPEPALSEVTSRRRQHAII
jgi:hypothetical protein